MIGLIGKKVGMTQVFSEKGEVIPVTLIEAGPCTVTEVRTPERHGYAAVQLGFGATRAPRIPRPILGQFKKRNLTPNRHLREFRVEDGHGLEVGQNLTVSIFEKGHHVDVLGVTKGRGFTGVVKRHGFVAGHASHGPTAGKQPGSIGSSAYPSRVVKGMRAAGRMGGGRVTIHNLKVLRVDPDNHLLIVEGGIPGAPSGYVIVRKAVTAKKLKVAQVEKPKKGKK